MTRSSWRRGAVAVLSLCASSLTHRAIAADAGPPPASACSESIPQGAEKPTLIEKVVAHAKAGELVTLSVAVRHAAGEEATLPADLPAIVRSTTGPDGAVRIAEESSWGRGAAPKAIPDSNDPKHATTLLEIPFVVLSTSIPRATFTLPPLRVILLRKGGGDMSVCTSTHEIAIDQPIASTPDPWPRPNPPSVPQITRDEKMQQLVEWSAIALLAGAALMAAFFWWRRRPKAAPAPAPAPAPWTVALKDIHAARDAFLTGKLATKPYFDRISDAVRVYLGRVYGFDGIDMTTDEILSRLKRLIVPVPIGEVTDFLGACDLVKFAGMQPPVDEGSTAAEMALGLVRATSPHGQGGMSMRQRAELASLKGIAPLPPPPPPPPLPPPPPVPDLDLSPKPKPEGETRSDADDDKEGWGP
jgi:hypothetical protein